MYQTRFFYIALLIGPETLTVILVGGRLTKTSRRYCPNHDRDNNINNLFSRQFSLNVSADCNRLFSIRNDDGHALVKLYPITNNITPLGLNSPFPSFDSVLPNPFHEISRALIIIIIKFLYYFSRSATIYMFLNGNYFRVQIKIKGFTNITCAREWIRYISVESTTDLL